MPQWSRGAERADQSQGPRGRQSDDRDVMSVEEAAVLPWWIGLHLEPNMLSGSQRVEPVHLQVEEVHEHVRLKLIGTEGAPTVLVAPPDTHVIDHPHQRTLPRDVVQWRMNQ